MRKILLSIFLLVLVSIVACQQAVKKETAPADTMKKTETPNTTTPKVETTGNAAVDAVGKDLNNVDSVDKDLSADQLGDLDSGLADVQNI